MPYGITLRVAKGSNSFPPYLYRAHAAITADPYNYKDLKGATSVARRNSGTRARPDLAYGLLPAAAGEQLLPAAAGEQRSQDTPRIPETRPHSDLDSIAAAAT